MFVGGQRLHAHVLVTACTPLFRSDAAAPGASQPSQEQHIPACMYLAPVRVPTITKLDTSCAKFVLALACLNGDVIRHAVGCEVQYQPPYLRELGLGALPD